MSLESALAAGRAAALARMASRGKTRRRTDFTTNGEGVKVAVWTVIHTDIPVRIGGTANAASSRVEQVAGLDVSQSRRVANLPHTTTDLVDGDYLEITSGELLGAVFRLGEVDWQDQATARRVPVVAVPRPIEW